MLQTEYEFTLPYGYVDGEGTMHRHGIMRLCTALDEVAAMQDARVRLNQAYLSILLLAQVVTRLGGDHGPGAGGDRTALFIRLCLSPGSVRSDQRSGAARVRNRMPVVRRPVRARSGGGGGRQCLIP